MSSQTSRQRPGKRLIGAYVPADLAERLAQAAEAEDRSVAYLIRRAVEAELEKAAA